MQTEKIKTALCWALTIVCMAVIFGFSSKCADESAGQSGRILQYLISIFGDNIFTDFIVRKAAHFLEFTGLSLLLNISLLQTKKRKEMMLAAGITSLYAVTDEIHQYFVPGRACRFTDWLIDTAGALFGCVIFLALFAIISAIYNKRKKSIDRENN